MSAYVLYIIVFTQRKFFQSRQTEQTVPETGEATRDRNGHTVRHVVRNAGPPIEVPSESAVTVLWLLQDFDSAQGRR